MQSFQQFLRVFVSEEGCSIQWEGSHRHHYKPCFINPIVFRSEQINRFSRFHSLIFCQIFPIIASYTVLPTSAQDPDPVLPDRLDQAVRQPGVAGSHLTVRLQPGLQYIQRQDGLPREQPRQPARQEDLGPGDTYTVCPESQTCVGPASGPAAWL